MVVRIPTRQEVRALVARQDAEKRAALQRGENIHQVGLDQLDKVKAYAAALSEAHGADTGVLFLNMWPEEMNAVTAQLKAQQATTATNVEQLGAAIGSIILFFVLYLLFSYL